MVKKVSLDKSLCIGCGACTSVSDNWKIGDDGLAYPVVELVTSDSDISSNEEASDVCPVNCITVEDSE